MNFFIFQSLLLIAVAYLIGALVGCWLRKVFKKSASMLHNDHDDMPGRTEVAAATAAAVATGAVVAHTPPLDPGEATIEITRGEPRTESEPLEPAVSPPIEAVQVEASAVRETITFVEPSERVVLAPEPVVEDIVIPGLPDVNVVSVVPAIPVVEAVVKPAIDDLTKIKGVGLPVALELKKIGITHFQQVANWTNADITNVSEKLGFSGRIERENWMAQAQILASGSELEFTTHQLSEAEQRSASTLATSQTTQTTTRTTTPVTAVAGAAVTGDDLKRVIGIGTNIEQNLNALGVSRFAQIATWTPDEVTAISRRLGIEGRIERENWIEQARQLG